MESEHVNWKVCPVFLVIVLASAAPFIAFAFSCAPAALTISVGEAKVGVGEVVPLDITIYAVDKGLSGYDLTVSLEDGEVGQIVDVVLPDFGLHKIGRVPATAVRIRAVDLKDIAAAGADVATLATVKIRGVKSGSTPVIVTLGAMDDDRGDPMEPQIVDGLIKVY